jgi:protease IV
LIDELAGMWEAGRRIHSDLKLKEKFGLRFLKPKKTRLGLSDLLQEAEGVMTQLKLQLTKNSGPAYLLDW